MRIVVLATGAFAVPALRTLVESKNQVLGLITRLPHDHQSPAASPAHRVAEQHGLPVFAPDDVNSPPAADRLKAWSPDVLVVCDYGQLLAPQTLSLAPLGGINLHGSLLPKYRGAAPVNWAIYRGESETGVSVIHMTARLDAGPCLVQRRTRIEPAETAPQLEQRLAQMGVDAVLEALEILEHWDRVSPIGTPQDPSQATRAPRLKKQDGLIDWTRSADQIERQVRAMIPWPGAYTFLIRPGKDPLRMAITQAQPADRPLPPGVPPGALLDSASDQLVIATGHGVLDVMRLHPAGKREMSVAEFRRGYPLPPGTHCR